MSRFRKERRQPSLHMAPLIDCVLLLLVFFMLTATYVNRGIPVELPSARGGKPLEPSATITITRDGVLFLEGEEVPLRALRERLIARFNEGTRRIGLRTDRSIPIGRVVEVLDIARDLGSEVSLVTENGAPREE